MPTKGIPVHYMSATVDTENLRGTLQVDNVIEADKQRYPIWMHNTHASMETCIVDLVENTLVYPDPYSKYFPQGRDTVSNQVRSAVLEEGRAKGLLIVVNSFAGENSDAQKIANMLRDSEFASEIEILLLASSVIRNPEEKKKFDRDMERIENERRKYVIIATSVVEMGITFPTLDFIVTMDSGYENITIGDSVLSDVVPLGVNSLKQRIGRVGRKRPGIGYITTEVEAYYTEFDDDELNGDGLIYEPIKLPMTKGTLSTLAYYSFVQKWQDIELELHNLNLPSAIQFSEERVERLKYERSRLVASRVAVDNELTPEGAYCERWLGLVDINYAMLIQQALVSGIKNDIVFYLVMASLSELCLYNLYDREEEPIVTRLADKVSVDQEEKMRHQDQRWGLRIYDDEIEYSPVNDAITMYNIISCFAQKYAIGLFGETKKADIVAEAYREALFKDCEFLGLSGQKLYGVLKGLNDLFKTFVSTNQKREEFQNLFGDVRRLTYSELMPGPINQWDVMYHLIYLKAVPGRVTLRLYKTPYEKEFDWVEKGGGREGRIKQSQTSVVLSDGLELTAKLLPEPGTAFRKAGDSWKVVHIQSMGGEFA